MRHLLDLNSAPLAGSFRRNLGKYACYRDAIAEKVQQANTAAKLDGARTSPQAARDLVHLASAAAARFSADGAGISSPPSIIVD